MRVSLFGSGVDVLTTRETIDAVERAMASRSRLHHVAMNVAKLVNLRSDPELAADVAASDIVGIDGMGIVLALRMKGIRAERVAGVDLMGEVVALAAERGFRPYLLGATEEVLQGAAARMKERHPNLVIAGMQHGYFKPAEEAEIVARIAESRADCLFVAMPTPRKERFLAAHRDRLGVPFIMGVGGSFDIWAGKTRRAPANVQRFGLEWLYRIYQEPRRMWWRYARTNTIFAGLLVQELFTQWGRGRSN